METVCTETEAIRRTPLFETHKQEGAKFVPFAGWEMPVLYSSIVEEHVSVRQASGIFDVSHMGEIVVSGPEALEALQYLTSNDVSLLSPGKAQYSLLLNEAGGVVDDIVVYMLESDLYLICVNASNAAKDFAWLAAKNTFYAEIENVSDQYAQIAVQGPKAVGIVADLLEISLDELSYYSFSSFTMRPFILSPLRPGAPGVQILAARTGYTGEDGFELFVAAEWARDVWQRLREIGSRFGMKPAGLGARDTLRLEAALPLHGHELHDDLPALCSGVGWVVKFKKDAFLGKEALLRVKEQGLSLKLVGLEVIEPGIVREGAPLMDQAGRKLGYVSSGTKTPSLRNPIALGFVPPDCSLLGCELWAEVRGKKIKTKVVERPFYKRVDQQNGSGK